MRVTVDQAHNNPMLVNGETGIAALVVAYLTAEEVASVAEGATVSFTAVLSTPKEH